VSAVHLDTSGSVSYRVHGIVQTKIWSDLDPFTQGYIEALFASKPLLELPQNGEDNQPAPGYRHLARETLARIIEDCDRRVTHEDIRWASDEAGRNSGRVFWRLQQDNDLSCFPPLTITLGDDGKVRFQ
jgi:hypothetical protein